MLLFISKHMDKYLHEEFSPQFFELLGYVQEQQRLNEYSHYEKSQFIGSVVNFAALTLREG